MLDDDNKYVHYHTIIGEMVKNSLHDAHEDVEKDIYMAEEKSRIHHIIMDWNKVVSIHHCEKNEESVSKGTESELYLPK